MLRDEYHSQVPDDFNALLKLPGVGRKSANLIMGDVFKKPAIVTDTHCIRLCNRIGLVHDCKDPKKVETQEVHINEYGTDDYSRLLLTYPDGCTAESVQTIGQELERNARIVGTKGSIFLPDFQHAETMTLEVKGEEPEVIQCPVDINGFEYEIREVSRCVTLGYSASSHYTPEDSLALTRLMYKIRMDWNMKFEGEA